VVGQQAGSVPLDLPIMSMNPRKKYYSAFEMATWSTLFEMDKAIENNLFVQRDKMDKHLTLAFAEQPRALLHTYEYLQGHRLQR